MASNITKDDREFFERYLKEHPDKHCYEFDSIVLDDSRMNFNHEEACLMLAKLFLEGKIK